MRPSFRPRASEGSRDDNAKVKAGETPAEWEAQPAKNRQKDKDARWTKKHGKAHYGYKNHINVDRRHKLVRRYAVTSASVHDSQKLSDVLDPANTASGVWADRLGFGQCPRHCRRLRYRSAEIEAALAARGPDQSHPLATSTGAATGTSP